MSFGVIQIAETCEPFFDEEVSVGWQQLDELTLRGVVSGKASSVENKTTAAVVLEEIIEPVA